MCEPPPLQRLLLQHEEQLQRLRGEPQLLGNAIEEILRFCPAIRIVPRTALKDIVLDGSLTVRAGETVLLELFRANCDPKVFGDDADRFDIGRDRPERHLTFGHGVHMCAGHALGRSQIRAVLQQVLLQRPVGSVRPAWADEPAWQHTYSTLESLPLHLDPVS